jgi:NTE family protein
MPIKNLSFGGGGIYGLSQLGALIELEKHHLPIQNVNGVSIGSVLATLYAIGYTTEEMINILMNMNFETLLKKGNPLWNMYHYYGLYDITDFEVFIENLIREKTHIKNCTFSQIEKKLTIVATNLSQQRLSIFNKETTPNMVVSKAIRLSISYPGIFGAAKYEDDWYVDGSLLMVNPIILFDKMEESIGIVLFNHGIMEKFANEEISQQSFIRDQLAIVQKMKINTFYDFQEAMAHCILSLHNKDLTVDHIKHCLIIPTEPELDLLHLSLSKDQKQTLLENGIRIASEQLKEIL